MKPATDSGPEATARYNYARLFMLRNAEIAAIGGGIAVAVFFFEIQLPLPQLLTVLALIALVNTYTGYRLKTGSRIGNNETFVLMLLDVAGLTGIFFYTGGASNPFVWFYLLPLMIAATILPRWQTWSMAVITVLCYTALFLVDTPGSGAHEHMQHATGFQMHVFGMWTGFVMSAGFVAVIIVGMANSLRERDRRLAEAREQALKNERLVALGTLATGTAHELGTPLGTMAILTSELEHDYAGSGNSELMKKLGILALQIDRCKEALSVLSASAGVQRAESGHRMPVRRFLDETIDAWQAQRPEARLRVHTGENLPPGEIIAERTLTQALINILNNAADASPGDIELSTTWTTDELTIGIADRGPGLSNEIQDLLGKHPVTTKSEGLGVGLYLAHATIQRLGGSLTMRNRTNGGTLLTVVLPLISGEHRTE